MNRCYLVFLGSLLLAGCGGSGDEAASEAAPAASTAPAKQASPPVNGEAVGPPPARAAQAGGGASPSLAGRTRELVNPDDATMVLLYFDLAGIAPPIDSWVQQDGRVMYANGTDKAAMREMVRQEIEAGMASVKGVGRIRLSLNSAQLSNYDPTYGEFTIRAFSPASTITFKAFRQEVEVRFGNGRTAQVWRIPPAEAQVISDRVGNYGNNVQIDTLLAITAVQPAMSGGTLVTDILEYELRETRGGTTIARVSL